MANQIQTDYGNFLIANEIKHIEPYVVITMEIPWQLCQHFFQNDPPEKVIMIDTLDKIALDKISETLPTNVNFIGFGGGTAIDAAKYFAYLQDSVPLIIPSITSTNAPFSDFISVRKNGSAYGFKVDGYPKKILIDYEVLKLSNCRYNRAGYGDLLYMQTTLNDWMIVSKNGNSEKVIPEVKQQIEQIIDLVTMRAKEIGEMTEEGIHLLMENIRLSTELYMDYPNTPISAGSEHLFAWNLELITGKSFVHGEIVALGLVITSYLQQYYIPQSHHQKLRNALDDAKVIYHPDHLGIFWGEIEETLLTIDLYNKRFRSFQTVFDYVKWSPELFSNLKDYLYK